MINFNMNRLLIIRLIILSLILFFYLSNSYASISDKGMWQISKEWICYDRFDMEAIMNEEYLKEQNQRIENVLGQDYWKGQENTLDYNGMSKNNFGGYMHIYDFKNNRVKYFDQNGDSTGTSKITYKRFVQIKGVSNSNILIIQRENGDEFVEEIVEEYDFYSSDIGTFWRLDTWIKGKQIQDNESIYEDDKKWVMAKLLSRAYECKPVFE